jgi:hypothetical protein
LERRLLLGLARHAPHEEEPLLSSPTNGTRTNGTPSGQDPVVARLDAIAARLDRLERQLAPVGELAENAPGVLATAVDTFDAAVAQHPDLPERAERAVSLAERVTEPQTAAALHKGLDAIDGMEGMVATAIDTMDATLAKHPDIPERLERVVALTERLTRDDTVASLHKALDVLEGMEGMVATAMDVLDERMATISDMHERIQAAEALLLSFTDPGHLQTLRWLATASMHGASGDVQPMTPWSAFKASKEPEVQRALGIAINIARSLGADHKQLEAPGKTS